MHATHAVSGQTALTMCTCGRYHLTYGPVTLHFTPTEFSLFAKDIARIASGVTDRRPPAASAHRVLHGTHPFSGGSPHDN